MPEERIQDAKPVGELFDVFMKFAEKSFSGGTSLKHIEQADSIESDWLKGNKSFEPEKASPDNNWKARRRANERPKLVVGLATYLFDRFIRGEDGLVNSVLLRLPTGDSFDLGKRAFTPLCEVDYNRIIFRNHPSMVRARLIQIAESQSHRYRFIDTRFWEVTRETTWINSLDDDNFSVALGIWDDIGSHAGAALYFDGKLPTDKHIEGMMGSTARLSDEHVLELVDEIHAMSRVIPFERMLQARVADRIGVPVNTKSFREKIWPKFLEGLSPEEKARLPKKGRRKEQPIEYAPNHAARSLARLLGGLIGP